MTAGRLVGVIRREFAAPHYVMVVGTGERAVRLARGARAIARVRHPAARLLRAKAGRRPARDPAAARPTRCCRSRELPAILRQHVIDEIIFAVGSESLAELEEVFLLCDEEGVRTRVAVDFFPHVNSKVSLDRFGATPLLTFSAAPHDEIRLLVKRVIDILIAAAGLMVLAPFMAADRAADPADLAGPGDFPPGALRLNGRRFLFYKFRSMCENAEEMKTTLEHLNARDTAFKIPDDPRLTPSAATCASSRSTNGRSCGMCCAATCRWWARGRRSRAKWSSTSAGSGAACACGPASRACGPSPAATTSISKPG